jgi:hypothetical protein
MRVMLVREKGSIKCASKYEAIRPRRGYTPLPFAVCLVSYKLLTGQIRLLHAHLQPKSIVEYAPVLMQSAKQHILDIIESPEKHQNHAKKQVV